MDYLVVIEKTATGYSGYAPDLPGCVASAKTAARVRKLMRDGIEFHIEGLDLEGYDRPSASTQALIFTVGESGKVTGTSLVETLYDIKSFAARMGVSPSTLRVYTRRFNIGRKMGRGWVFTDRDIPRVPAWS